MNTQNTKEIVLQEKGNLIIPIEIKNKLKFIFDKCPTDEWSGLLFYKFTQESDKKITCEIKDIYLMDKGHPTATSYEYTTEIIDVFDAYPDLINCKIGHCHSHPTFSTNFSSVDMQELHNNAPNHVYYLSVIFNKFGEVTAKLCFEAEQEVTQSAVIKFKNSLQNLFSIPTENTVKEKVLFVMNMDINNTSYEVTDEFFKKRVVEVLNKKKELPVATNINKSKLDWWDSREYYKDDDYFPVPPYKQHKSYVTKPYEVKKDPAFDLTQKETQDLFFCYALSGYVDRIDYFSRTIKLEESDFITIINENCFVSPGETLQDVVDMYIASVQEFEIEDAFNTVYGEEFYIYNTHHVNLMSTLVLTSIETLKKFKTRITEINAPYVIDLLIEAFQNYYELMVSFEDTGDVGYVRKTVKPTLG